MLQSRSGYYTLAILGPLVLVAVVANIAISALASPKPTVVEIPVQRIEASAATEQLVTGQPVRLRIPAAKIDIAVEPGNFNAGDNSWTLSDNTAHYATPTVAPNNQAGNTFIYGHNVPAVFAGLSGVGEAAEAYLETGNGHSFRYRFSHRQTVSPYDLSLFEYRGAPMLTLQTCSGLWYQNRDLLWFSLSEAR